MNSIFFLLLSLTWQWIVLETSGQSCCNDSWDYVMEYCGGINILWNKRIYIFRIQPQTARKIQQFFPTIYCCNQQKGMLVAMWCKSWTRAWIWGPSEDRKDTGNGIKKPLWTHCGYSAVFTQDKWWPSSIAMGWTIFG